MKRGRGPAGGDSGLANESERMRASDRENRLEGKAGGGGQREEKKRNMQR